MEYVQNNLQQINGQVEDRKTRRIGQDGCLQSGGEPELEERHT